MSRLLRKFAPLVALLLAPLAALAQRQPVLKQIQVPHPYYYREMYLPQVTSGPRLRDLVARRPRAGLLDAGLALAAGARIQGSAAAHERARLRLPARLVARRPLPRLCVLPRRRRGAVGARACHRPDSAADRQPRGQRRAALVARRKAHRLRLDGLQPALALLRGRGGRRTAREDHAAHGRQATAASRATTTANATTTFRRAGRPTAARSCTSPTAGASGARAESGG